MDEDKIERACPLLSERVTLLEAQMVKVRDAFPGEDYDGHRRAHKTMIEDIESRKRLTQAVREKTISGLIWLAIVALGTLLWTGIKHRLGGNF